MPDRSGGNPVYQGTDRKLADTDGDDLTDGEEVNMTLTNRLSADSDDDGTPDGDSRFTTTLVVTPAGDTELSLPTISGRRYVILRSIGLKNWLVLRELIGTGAEVRAHGQHLLLSEVFLQDGNLSELTGTIRRTARWQDQLFGSTREFAFSGRDLKLLLDRSEWGLAGGCFSSSCNAFGCSKGGCPGGCSPVWQRLGMIR